MNSSQYPFTVFSINHYNQNLFWSTHDPHLRNQRQPGEKKSKAEKHWDLSLWCSSNLWSSRIGKFIMRSLTVTHRYNLQPLNTNPQLVTLLEGQINCMRLTIAYQKDEDNKALFWLYRVSRNEWPVCSLTCQTLFLDCCLTSSFEAHVQFDCVFPSRSWVYLPTWSM